MGKAVLGNQIIIYGAGVIATSVVEKFIYEERKDAIIAVAVTKKEGNPSHIFNIPVVEISELRECATTCDVLIAMKKTTVDSVKETLFHLGFCNVYSLHEGIWKKWYEEKVYRQTAFFYINTVRKLCEENGVLAEAKEKIVERELQALKEQDAVSITRLVVVLGTKCSLRCKECNNLMPYFKPQKDLDKEKILEALELFLQKVRTVLRMELIGGEPFLSQNLNDVLAFLLKQEKVGQIEITTNGTIIPKAELIPLLQNSRVKVRISDYGELVDKSKLIAFLEENHICYQVLEGGKWISPGNTEKRGRSKEELAEQYKNCAAVPYCKTLYEDKIYVCARAASLGALGYMKEKEYLEITEVMLVQDIKEFWIRDYSIACDYCDHGNKEKKWIAPAEQMERDA